MSSAARWWRSARGAGANLGYFGPRVRWIGVDPNPYVHHYLRERAAQCGLDTRLLVGAAERLPLADASADAVVATLVLCTVYDVRATLEEARRVLRPGGRFVFIEHVAAPEGSLLRRAQRLLRRPCMLLGDGCRPDRDTEREIRGAGFRAVEVERWQAPARLSGPHILGYAER